MLSTMTAKLIDGNHVRRIAELSRHVLDGGEITAEQGRWLFHLEGRGEIFELLAWADRLREEFKGNKIHLCSIVNAKAGACSENCSFCAQSSFYQTGSPRYGFVDPEPEYMQTGFPTPSCSRHFHLLLSGSMLFHSPRYDW